MDYRAQLLRPAETTKFKRETASVFVIVMEGEGYSEVGGQRFDWQKNDVMVMPNYLWRRHVNGGKGDAILYTVSDAALMRNIGNTARRAKKTTAPSRRSSPSVRPGAPPLDAHAGVLPFEVDQPNKARRASILAPWCPISLSARF